MEKAAVHGATVEDAERAAVGVRKNSLPPKRAMMSWNFALISASASSHEMRWKSANVPEPLSVTRRMGYSRRSGEYTRSRYCATLAHKKPRVTGCMGSPLMAVACGAPFLSSIVMSTPQASGQSWGQAAWTVREACSKGGNIIRSCDYKHIRARRHGLGCDKRGGLHGRRHSST